MFEKLLLAGTITFALNFFIGVSAQSTRQTTVVAQGNHSAVYVAKALHDRPLLQSLFQ